MGECHACRYAFPNADVANSQPSAPQPLLRLSRQYLDAKSPSIKDHQEPLTSGSLHVPSEQQLCRDQRPSHGASLPTMPPGNSQKGTGKKGASAMARQRSRNTTPSSVPPTTTATASLPPVETVDTEYLELKFELLRNISYDDLVDSGTPSAVIPDSRSLDGIATRLQRLQDLVEQRTSNCDRGMRLLAANRKARMDEIAAERGREDDRRRREADEEEKERRANKKKRKATESLAPQDNHLGQFRIFCVPFMDFISYSPLFLPPHVLWIRASPSITPLLKPRFSFTFLFFFFFFTAAKLS